jgi:hypothetical protein
VGRKCVKNSDFGIEIRVRGEVDYLHRETCVGLEDAVRKGRMKFLVFDERNPWLFRIRCNEEFSFCSILKQRRFESNIRKRPSLPANKIKLPSGRFAEDKSAVVAKGRAICGR